MKKILAIGSGPLLEKGVRKIGGHCLRTWHFVSPLLEDGHWVSLVTLPIPDHSRPPESFREHVEKRKYEGFAYQSVLKEDPAFLKSFFAEEMKRLRPDCIVGINTHPAAVAARSASILPFWADLNGWAMAEGQTRARLDGSDTYLPYFWADERDACRRADRFSTVSKNQKLALIGELAAMGRMNRFTFDYPFADVVENAVNPLFAGEPDPGQPLLVRGTRTPQDAFIILWSGGFNTWTNVNLLYEGLARAMEKDEKVYFASTGGSIDGHDEKTYAEFHRLLAASPFRKRFILLGWIKAEELFPLYCECDAGLNVDAMNYETMFGARNRITNMLAAGLPVLTTLGTEISRTVETERLGLAFPMDDPDLMAGAILDLAQNRVLCREMSVASRRYALENYSNSGTTQPLRDWVRNPKLAPDNQEKVIRYPSTDDLLSVWTNDIEKTHALLGDRDALSLVNDSRDLWIIRSNPLFKLYKSLKGVFKKK